MWRDTVREWGHPERTGRVLTLLSRCGLEKRFKKSMQVVLNRALPGFGVFSPHLVGRDLQARTI
jgi:hypothetical protein